MNRTVSFKEAVKAAKKRHADESSASEGEHPDLFPVPDKNRILPTSKKRKQDDGFESRGRIIVENVTRLKEFLGENRNAYLDVMNNECLADAITDIERDKIDAGAQNFVKTINALLTKFKSDLKEKIKGMKGQRIKHFEAVTDILDDYLRSVCEIHSRQKAIRVEKELEMQRFSRLEVKARSSTATKSNTEEEETGSEGDDESSPGTRHRKRKKKSVNRATPVPPPSGTGNLYSSDDDNEASPEVFSSEEVQMLEQENVNLYEDLMTMKDSVRQIESKVVKIAELQDVFTSKVLQQKDDIDIIAAHAVASTENIKDGNEELRRAIQRNASIRVYILFFLLVMSFSLLFLDWYNE